MFSSKTLSSNLTLPGSRKEIPGFNRFGADPNGFWGQLQRIPAKYYLEIRRGSKVDSVISFPYDPDSMQYNRINPHSITYTLGGVLREVNTIRSHDIVFEGRSGTAFRTAYTRDGGISNLTGNDAFKEFDEFLKRYTELSNLDYGVKDKLIVSTEEYSNKILETGSNAKTIQLILRCIDEDLHLAVEPLSFSYGKNAQYKHDYRYRLQLKAYDYAYSSAYNNIILGALDTANGYINAVGGAIGTLSNVVDNVSNDYISGVRGTIRNASAALNKVGDVSKSIGSLTTNAAGVISDVVALGDNITGVGKTFNDLTDALETLGSPELVKTRNELVSGMLNTPRLTGDFTRDLRNSQFIAELSQFINESQNLRGVVDRRYFNQRHLQQYKLGEWLSNEQNLSLLNTNIGKGSGNIDRRNAFPYEINKNDDLIQIATKLTGEAANADLIQEFNDWVDYRRNNQGDYPQPGDIIYIPDTLIRAINPFLDRGDLIGNDIRMDWNDCSLNDLNNEIETVSGAENIKQYIKNALLTVAGEVPGFETYGLRALSRISDTGLLSTYIRDTLIADTRIIDINNIDIEIKQDTVNVSFNVKTILNNNIQFRVPYPI